MKALINKLAGAAYRRVFNREMSAAEGDFVQGLSWVSAGTFVATGLIAVFSILGGRLLGPEEYGKFTLVHSIAMFLHIPMLMGFDIAMLKYNAEKDDSDRRKSITSTAYVIIAVLTAASAAIMLRLAQPLAGLFAATPELLRLSIWFAVLFALFSLAQTTLRSIGQMRAFAFSHVLRAVILLAAFAVFVLLDRLSFQSMVYSALAAFVVAGLGIYILYTRSYSSFRFDAIWARTMSRFAFAYVGAGISSVIYGNIGKIVVAHYMTVADVGIYGAYFTATISIILIAVTALNMVFLPTASKYKDKRPLLRRLNRVVPLAILLGTPLVMGTGYVILQLYGGEYPFSLLWLALFTMAGVAFAARGFYVSLSTSQGARGALLSSISGVITALVNLGLCVILVPLIGISGAMVAATIGYLAGLIVILWKGRWH